MHLRTLGAKPYTGVLIEDLVALMRRVMVGRVP